MKELETILTYTSNEGNKIQFQHDKDNRLYINGKKVLTEKEITLKRPERIFALMTALGIFLQGFSSFCNIFK